MGQPIKNIIDYEKRFSKEMKNLLSYVNSDFLEAHPVKEITIEMFFSAALLIDDSLLTKVLEGYLNSMMLNVLQNKISLILSETTLTALKPGRKIEYSQELKNLFIRSLKECDKLDCEFITSDHVLLACLSAENGNEVIRVQKEFNSVGVGYNVIFDRAKKIHSIADSLTINKQEEPDTTENDESTTIIKISGNIEDLDNFDLPSILGGIAGKRQQKNTNDKKTKSSIQYCTNLNEKAQNNELSTVIGREREIEQIITILNRKKANNVILVGESGCGKTTIVEGLAKMIVDGTAPLSISDKIIFKFNANELTAGTQLRGMLEDRMTSMFKELRKRENAILFIDDFHSFFNDRRDDDNNLTSLILPFLQDSKCKIIAATTHKGYKNSLGKNKEIENRFNKVNIEDPSLSDSRYIILKTKSEYEKYHNVHFSDEIIETILILSEKYSIGKNLLSTSFDIIDEIGAKQQVQSKETIEIEEKRKELITAVNNNDSDLTDSIRLELAKLISKKRNDKPIEITESDVYEAFASYSNLPITKISTPEKKTINNIDKVLKSVVIGQDEAVDVISRAIKRSKVGLSPKNKPLATFMFVGTTGVGKTLLAKMLAKEVYNDEKNLVRFDMSEYSDKTSVNKLIGSSAGYIGYNDGGLLTEAIKAKKHCVLLLDEIEKANEEVYNLFLQVFDDGYLTDNTGNKVDFRNTIIILTSNIGTKMASETRSLGFGTDDSFNKKDVIEKELKKKFPPEFVNRLDEIVYFNSLNDENLKEIIKLELNKLKKRLNEINYSLSWDNNVVDSIFGKIVDQKEYGARPIAREIQTSIENQITDMMLERDYNKNYTFKCYLNETIKVL